MPSRKLDDLTQFIKSAIAVHEGGYAALVCADFTDGLAALEIVEEKVAYLRRWVQMYKVVATQKGSLN